jgi:hypothetical protein
MELVPAVLEEAGSGPIIGTMIAAMFNAAGSRI